ncbi:general secretion pathway protein GspB [uncultured Thiocystis sp.]|jgi:general secretion pathway protein B|uniref:general secretion pathway protein GspB n=1 Tax=uncultured Thiocystis sp. TaxID=1202134 RepID=UPI0025E9E600|nr:general secretion pathway protein GspB [uncultured Thiocystis sp.]
MSYILEALKKSQQERELGQVPTLDMTGIFSEDKEPVPANHWGLLAVGLATLAVVIALFAALRGPASPPVAPTAAKALDSQRPSSLENPGGPAAADEEPAAPAPAPLRLAPLVEAPPPKHPVRAIPATPDVRGDTAGGESGPEEFMDYPNPNLDPALERELQRQLDAEQLPSDDPEPLVSEPPSRAPIPVDLLDDIESFKQQVRREQGLPPPKSKAKSAPVKIDGDPTRLRLTPQQQAQVPGYLMTVHVYDPDVAKRFVLINALKYREGEETREGLRVERILSDGAVLSYLGNPFYVAR